MYDSTDMRAVLYDIDCALCNCNQLRVRVCSPGFLSDDPVMDSNCELFVFNFSGTLIELGYQCNMLNQISEVFDT